jgi:hypothetical protein
MAPNDALIDVVPALLAAARPLDPAALLIEAVEGFELLQVTAVLKFCVELSV